MLTEFLISYLRKKVEQSANEKMYAVQWLKQIRRKNVDVVYLL